MSTANTNTEWGGSGRAILIVGVITWLAIIFDGYDLIVYGTVVPSLLEDPQWTLTPAHLGLIGSYTLVGLLIGALSIGAVTDLIGRKKTIVLCLSWFSVAMALCAIAPTPESFGFFRFLNGLGLGGLLATANALVIEYCPTRRRTFIHAIIMTGFPAGGILAATLAIPLIPAFGWRTMFWIGIAPVFFVVPLALKFLPESMSFLLAHNRRDEAEALARRFGVPLQEAEVSSTTKAEETATASHRFRALASLFSRRYILATILFGFAVAMNLLTAYGLLTWLPQIMQAAGYELGSALSFLVALNVAALIGLPLAGALADRLGSKVVCATIFLMAAAAIGLLSFTPSLVVTYILAGVAGFGTIGLQIQLNAYVAKYYSVGNRATALGWALGVGRLGAMIGPVLGGLVIASELGQGWNFYFFALASFIGAIALILVPRSSEVSVEATSVPSKKATPA